MKKIIFIIFSLSLIIFFSNCSHKEKEYATILYFNDAHQIYPVKDNFGERGGVARLKTIVEKVKRENRETIIVFGGDLAGGTLFGGLYHGFPMIEAFNLIPIDIANFGQHDFDFGSNITKQLVDSSNFRWFSSNLKDNKNNAFHNLPTYIIKQKAGLKICFIGLTDKMNTTKQDGKIIQEDLFESCKNSLLKIKNENPDIIIALTQTALKINEKLLNEFPQINAIFTEEQYENRSNIYYVHNRPIISPCGNMGSVVRVDLNKIDDEIDLSVKVHALDSLVAENKELAILQEKYKNKLNEELSKPIGKLLCDLKVKNNLYKETKVGNLITDAFRDYYNCDIAIINGAGIRANVDKGLITLKDAYSLLPFGNKICLVKLSGKMLYEYIQNSLTKNIRNSFLQISGANYKYINNKLVSININNKSIYDNKEYTVAISNYLIKGGEGFKTIPKNRILITQEKGTKGVDILINYCEKLKIINPKIESRIINLKKIK
ncbi:MAG: bifunctional metallophosphatase/5'-nucleotidase [Bacteroidetes bacterium]|nr:bifunctional metallophosphatase/5'-nucleotidase [Bacteroidota bacterium]